MKAFLIDSFLKLVSEVDTDGTLEHLRSLVGVDLFCTTPFDHEHDLWLDDLGLTVPGRSETMQDVQRYFVLRDDLRSDRYTRHHRHDMQRVVKSPRTISYSDRRHEESRTVSHRWLFLHCRQLRIHPVAQAKDWSGEMS